MKNPPIVQSFKMEGFKEIGFYRFGNLRIQMKIFDPINTLLKGTNLIEASAGTGKTYTIAGIFLRLILENGLRRIRYWW